MSIEISEQPKKIISYREGESDHIIASLDGAHVQLMVLSSSFSFSSLSPELSVAKNITAAANIPSFKIFRHHIAQSILALFSAREGIVQLWQLSALTHSDTRLITNLCTIYSVEEGLSSPSLSPEDSEKVSNSNTSSRMHKIYSVLVHSSGAILTGHDDGKIKVWDYGPILSDDVISPEQEGHYSRRTLTESVHTIQSSPSGNLVNGLLEYCHQVGSDSGCDIVSTDTDGFIRLWRFLDHSTSNNGFQLSLVGQHKMFDHSSLCRAISSQGWLVAGGKEGNNEDNDACGLNTQVKMLNLASLLDDGRYSSAEVKELGEPSLAVWDLKIVNSSEDEGDQHIVVSLMRRGRAWLEVWKI